MSATTAYAPCATAARVARDSDPAGQQCPRCGSEQVLPTLAGTDRAGCADCHLQWQVDDRGDVVVETFARLKELIGAADDERFATVLWDLHSPGFTVERVPRGDTSGPGLVVSREGRTVEVDFPLSLEEFWATLGRLIEDETD